MLIQKPGLELRHASAWLQDRGLTSRALQAELTNGLPWEQPLVRVYGRQHPTPRLTCWVADPGCRYRYSGLEQAITPWTPALEVLRQLLQAELGVRFNSLLLNRYRDGADRMGWHADDEPELDAAAPIASLSLGATRSLRFRPKPRIPWPLQPPPPFAVELADGDLLVMAPPTQQHWQHGLPARARVGTERLNLTFRCLR